MAVTELVKLTRALSGEMDREEGRHHYFSLPTDTFLFVHKIANNIYGNTVY